MDTQTEPEVIDFEITNDCTCVAVDEEGEALLDKYGDTIPSDVCWDCFDEEVENLNYCVIEPWLEKHPELNSDTRLTVLGEGMNWNRVSGWTTTKNATAKEIVDALSINTSWILRFRLDNDELTVIRYSHDEPMGTGRFRFRASTDEELDY